MDKICTMKYFNIYSDNKDHFIVHNMRKKFAEGHTHIDNYKAAKYTIYLALYKKIPKRHLSIYLVDSVIRISTDINYIHEMEKYKQSLLDKQKERVEV